MLYEDVDFKTLSDRYTNRRIIPFLAHIDGVRAKSSVKITPTMVNQQLKLDATNFFPSNTAEVRPIYLKMSDIMRKPVFVIREQQKRRSACASTQSDQRLCCLLPE